MPFGVFGIKKDVPKRLRVVFDGIEYYPVEYVLAYSDGVAVWMLGSWIEVIAVCQPKQVPPSELNLLSVFFEYCEWVEDLKGGE